MEVNPTQGSTQPYSDPRRMGSHNSGLLDEDVSDILCILHPGSPSAHELVEATSRLDKGHQHILQRDEFEYDTDGAVSRDIALRLSSSVKDLSAGFVFGRNPHRCDILLSPDVTSKTVSNTHFRIYVNEEGILMLEDTSTNGTIVDSTRLWKRNGQTTRMLINGSVIIVASDKKEVRFVVRIPPRDGFNIQYQENLIAYLHRVAKHAAKVKNLEDRTPKLQHTLQWTLGNPSHYGMHWNGGSIYNVTGQIGKGAFATVYKLATKQDGAVYAAKELDKRRFMKNGILDQKVDNEMKIMKDLRHPNIVQYIDHYEHDRWIYIIMEYVAGGELSTYLSESGKIAEDMAKSITRQLLHALHYLHKRKITHRDIKPDNILISSFEPLRVKLSDFGLSKSVQEETFMKTFCGTLLYCAPEVYPEYENYRQGAVRKRRRLGDPPPRTSPYNQSVDMWSLGAVLFHILCGSPPFTGRADDRGVQMLRTIMTTEADYGLLQEAGVSAEGIDFVSQLLCTDPHERPNEKQLFKHPWIADVADIDEYSDAEISAVDEKEEGLPLINEAAEEELDASQLSIRDNDEERDAYDAAAETGVSQLKRPRLAEEGDVHYPSLPSLKSFPVATSPQRLFGEVSPSGLHNSGIFDGLGPSAFSFDSSQSPGESMDDGGDDDDDDNGLLSAAHSFPHPRFGGSSLGVWGVNSPMGPLQTSASDPESLRFAFHAADAPDTPRSSAKQEGTPANQSLADPESNGSPNAHDATPKALPIHRRIELPLPDTASESSNPHDDGSFRTGPLREDNADLDELATTLDARTGKEVSAEARAAAAAHEDALTTTIPRAPPRTTFAKPLPLLGKLVSVPGSVFDLTLRLESRMTSWGRGPYATVVHPDRMDTRIPAYAIEVTFWSPGVEARIAEGVDWMDIPDVMTILSTKTRKCIWVNGVELRRAPDAANGKQAFQFGKLYTGDVITIFSNGDKYLRFRCEFYHGESARPRPASEKGFIVRQVLYPKSDSKQNRLANSKRDPDGNKVYA